MKNNYEILGVNENATQAEIENAYVKKIMEYDTGIITESVLFEIRRAFWNINISNNNNQNNQDLEEEKEVKPTIDNNEKSRKTNKGLVIYSTVLSAIVLIGGISWFSLIKNTKHKEEPEVKPTITNTIDKPIPTPIIIEEKGLTAENFESEVEKIHDYVESKGLSIDKAMIRSALFVTNIDYLNQEDIKTLYNDLNINITEEISNMAQYVSAVTQHNISKSKEITLTNLIYDEEDFAIIQALEEENNYLRDGISSNSITKTEYNESFDLIADLYRGNGYITTANGEKFSINSFTAGGGALSELYWPSFNVAYMSSNLKTRDHEKAMESISLNIINNSKYLAAIQLHESIGCLKGNQKTLK